MFDQRRSMLTCSAEAHSHENTRACACLTAELKQDGSVALHWAAIAGHVEVASFLLNSKASTDVQDKTCVRFHCSNEFWRM